jgi:hypothetical protein
MSNAVIVNSLRPTKRLQAAFDIESRLIVRLVMASTPIPCLKFKSNNFAALTTQQSGDASLKYIAGANFYLTRNQRRKRKRGS